MWLFGSVLRAWFHEGSDLDLAAEGVRADDQGRALDRLQELTGEDLDLVFLEDAEAGLRRWILQTGELLGESEAAAGP